MVIQNMRQLRMRKNAIRTHRIPVKSLLDAMESLYLNVQHGFGDRVLTVSCEPVDAGTHEEVGCGPTRTRYCTIGTTSSGPSSR